jgi:hypothetical protein
MAVVSAGFFGDDAKTERKKKRGADDKKGKRDGRKQRQKDGPSKDEVLLESDI